MPNLLATLPMEPLRLDVVGTRVLCHDAPAAAAGGNNFSSESNKIIVLDVWNPDSVRLGDVGVTEMEDMSTE